MTAPSPMSTSARSPGSPDRGRDAPSTVPTRRAPPAPVPRRPAHRRHARRAHTAPPPTPRPHARRADDRDASAGPSSRKSPCQRGPGPAGIARRGQIEQGPDEPNGSRHVVPLDRLDPEGQRAGRRHRLDRRHLLDLVEPLMATSLRFCSSAICEAIGPSTRATTEPKIATAHAGSRRHQRRSRRPGPAGSPGSARTRRRAAGPRPAPARSCSGAPGWAPARSRPPPPRRRDARLSARGTPLSLVDGDGERGRPSPSKGRWPVSTSKRVTPRAQMSARVDPLRLAPQLFERHVRESRTRHPPASARARRRAPTTRARHVPGRSRAGPDPPRP